VKQWFPGPEGSDPGQDRAYQSVPKCNLLRSSSTRELLPSDAIGIRFTGLGDGLQGGWSVPVGVLLGRLLARSNSLETTGPPGVCHFVWRTF